MQILKLGATPQPDGKIQLQIIGRDDTGRILSSVVVADSVAAVPTVAADAIRSLETLAATFTEEETFPNADKK